MSRKIVRDGKRTRKNDKKPRKMVKTNKDSRNRENDKKELINIKRPQDGAFDGRLNYSTTTDS